MFIGHFGTAFGAKALAPRVSLGTLFIAAQFIDLLWPVLLLLGLEQVSIVPGITRVTPLDFTSYPISHSLLMVCLWGAVVGGAYWLVRRNRTAAVTLGLLVISHWVLDFFTHRPDLPLTPVGETRVGLGLWGSPVGTVLLEGGIFALGVFFYLRASRARDRIGTWAFWGLVAFLLLVYAANLAGDPPPSVTAIAWAGQLQWLFVLWGYWVDRHRVARVIP